MKIRLIAFLLALVFLMSLVPTAVSAAETQTFSGSVSDTITWKLDPAKGELTIEGTGDLPDYTYSEGSPWYAYRSRIYEAAISEGITAIGDYAFHGCVYLTAIDAAGCTLTKIGKGALSCCGSLESFSFQPADTVEIGADAFFGCKLLKELNLSAAEGSIGEGAFEGCAALEKLGLPKQAETLGRDTFSGCAALTALDIPDAVTCIGKYCFMGCKGLTALSFPSTLTKVERSAFTGCGSLTLTFSGDAPDFAPADDPQASFPADAILKVPYESQGWEWPICRGYETERVYPSLVGVFDDVAESAWYASSVQHVYFTSRMNGMGNNAFAPNRSMTRAQLVTVLYRMADSPKNEAQNPFTDVASTAYYYDAVLWAQTNGIVTGVSATEFGADQNITRQQMCTILYRYAALLKLDLTKRSPLTGYADQAMLASYAQDPVSWCVAMGFINGKPGNLLDPLGTATRAEIAKVLTAFDTYLCRAEILSRDDWKEDYPEPSTLPEIDREDPLYLYAREIFDAINAKRAESGLSAVKWNDRIYLAAQLRAKEISAENGFGHTRPDGTKYSTVFAEFGIESSTHNEIVAHGYTAAQELVNVWASYGSTSPVISALIYSTGAVGVYQLPAKEGETTGKYCYAYLVIG